MEKIISKINELYDLDIERSEKINKGYLSENHIIYSSHKKYFLKWYRFNDQNRIEEIHAVKNYFADGGLPVVLPTVNREGKGYFFCDGYFAVFPYINDKQPERGTLNDKEIISLGETLGKIHLRGKNAPLKILERFSPWNKEKSLAKIATIQVNMDKIPNKTEFDILAEKIIGLKKKLIQSNDVKFEDLNLPNDHLIHGDYLDQNVFFGSDEQVSYIFDFEKCNFSPRMYELYRSMFYAFLSGDINTESKRKAKLYLDSYLSIYPATKDELDRGLKLIYLKSIHGLWVEGEHYLNNNTRADELLALDYCRVLYLSQNPNL